jgi:hypothetical protein
VLWEGVSPPPAGAEALTPDAPWAVAADVLAREALDLEQQNSQTWLLPGASLDGVSHLIRRNNMLSGRFLRVSSLLFRLHRDWRVAN